MERVKNKKKIRGYILKGLTMSYCQTASVGSLQSLVLSTQLTESIDIVPYLDYLEDRGYIRIKEKETELGFVMKFIKLTSKGTDLLEGTISDAGVIIDGRG